METANPEQAELDLSQGQRLQDGVYVILEDRRTYVYPWGEQSYDGVRLLFVAGTNHVLMFADGTNCIPAPGHKYIRCEAEQWMPSAEYMGKPGSVDVAGLLSRAASLRTTA